MWYDKLLCVAVIWITVLWTTVLGNTVSCVAATWNTVLWKMVIWNIVQWVAVIWATVLWVVVMWITGISLDQVGQRSSAAFMSFGESLSQNHELSERLSYRNLVCSLSFEYTSQNLCRSTFSFTVWYYFHCIFSMGKNFWTTLFIWSPSESLTVTPTIPTYHTDILNVWQSSPATKSSEVTRCYILITFNVFWHILNCGVYVQENAAQKLHKY